MKQILLKNTGFNETPSATVGTNWLKLIFIHTKLIFYKLEMDIENKRALLKLQERAHFSNEIFFLRKAFSEFVRTVSTPIFYKST